MTFKQCPAISPACGARCYLTEGHEGPHQLGILYKYHEWPNENEITFTYDGTEVWVRILEARDDYPPIPGTNKRRHLGVGDMTVMPARFAQHYIDRGMAEYYDPRKKATTP